MVDIRKTIKPSPTANGFHKQIVTFHSGVDIKIPTGISLDFINKCPTWRIRIYLANWNRSLRVGDVPESSLLSILSVYRNYIAGGGALPKWHTTSANETNIPGINLNKYYDGYGTMWGKLTVTYPDPVKGTAARQGRCVGNVDNNYAKYESVLKEYIDLRNKALAQYRANLLTVIDDGIHKLTNLLGGNIERSI